MLIELQEIEVTNGNIFDRDNYPSTGLYIADDGVVHHLVHIPEDKDMGICAIPIPLKQVEKYISKKIERDLHSDQVNRYEEIIEKLDLILASKESELKECTTDTNGDTLLKAIAIAQNPELAKEIL